MPWNKKTGRRRRDAGVKLAARQGGTAGRAVATELGRVVRRLRDEHSLTLTDVASRADISPAMLSRLETGQTSPSLETLVSLAAALGVRPSLLLRDLGET